MKRSRLTQLLITAAFIVPAMAHAHPGHDGDHDFVWDFGHFASHPLATIAGGALLGTALWGGKTRLNQISEHVPEKA